ncbi:FeoC-like transcriptional regulator [uncultured Clostridium sp.]|uniref:FeoC-like transcriptional regulator n=1 Tax=uncultured Clostridium sp. TaxID=59620 RepID=UPI00258F8236|nr:FeoC-like transcriptional regulator [uncultured Clostridium sp.]
MIKKILNELKKNGDFSSKTISRNLDIPKEMVDDMKDRLIKMGYLEKKECNENMCKGCSCGCSSRELNKSSEWIITEKGEKIINRGK